MNANPNKTIVSLRARLPEYLEKMGVQLRKNGNRLIGKCPMHDDRKPSFAVFGTGYTMSGCYPCDFTGDVFALSQRMGRAGTFLEAVADVAATLGVFVPDRAKTSYKATQARPVAARKPEPPFELSKPDWLAVRAARLRFSDAWHSDNPIVDAIAASLGVKRETLRHACYGDSGLGLACPAGSREPWLCYVYPQGLKWRNPHATSTPRFRWIHGKATAPWRMELVRRQTKTVYLTEGESDTLALIDAGIEDDGTAVCVASPGTSFPDSWGTMFADKRIVICFDSDTAGKAATLRVAEILSPHASEILSWKGGIAYV